MERKKAKTKKPPERGEKPMFILLLCAGNLHCEGYMGKSFDGKFELVFKGRAARKRHRG